MAVRPNLGIFTQPISFIGLPVVAAPIQSAAGALPLAVQLVAAPWAERSLLRLAPQLHFQPDEELERGNRLDELITRAVRDDAARHAPDDTRDEKG